MPPRSHRSTTLLSLLSLSLLVACAGPEGDSGLGEETGTTETSGEAESSGDPDNEVDCQPQGEVSQTLFRDDPESVVLVDVPDGWTPERFTNQVGYLAVAPSEFATDRPDVGIANMERLDRSVVALVTDNLVEVANVRFLGEDVPIYLQTNQPESGVNLEAYFPTTPAGEELLRVSVLTRYVGGPDDQAACQDSLFDLAVLVASSLRENPAWAG